MPQGPKLNLDLIQMPRLVAPTPLDPTPLEQTNPRLASLRDFILGAVGVKDALTPTSSNSTVAGAALSALLPVGMAMGGLKKVGAAAQPIKAYHGSPHDFEQFSLSKIGTGEGAQAYGHGLYFAENPKVAQDYRKALSGPQQTGPWSMTDPLVVQGKAYQDPRDFAESFGNINSPEYGGALDAAQAWSRDGSPYVGGDDIAGLIARDKASKNPRARAYGQAAEALQTAERPKGRTYEVGINAHPDDFLDWDKPLSQQSAKVQQALQKIGIELKPVHKWEAHQITQADIDAGTVPKFYAPGSWISAVRDPAGKIEWHAGQVWGSKSAAESNAALRSSLDERASRDKGSEIYHDLAGLTKAESTDKLKAAGIKGIRYLDQGSRGTKEGTSNYVVFDDAIIEIMKKYAVPFATAASMLELQKKQPSKDQ